MDHHQLINKPKKKKMFKAFDSKMAINQSLMMIILSFIPIMMIMMMKINAQLVHHSSQSSSSTTDKSIIPGEEYTSMMFTNDFCK